MSETSSSSGISDLVQGDKSRSTAATQDAPPSSAGPNQNQEPEDASEKQLLDGMASMSVEEKPVGSVENDYESKTSLTLDTRTSSPSRGDESRMNEQPSTAKERRKSALGLRTPKIKKRRAGLERKGEPTDNGGPGFIYALTSPKFSQCGGCVKVGSSEGNLADAISSIREQEPYWGRCTPKAVLATKHHKLADLLTCRILGWPNGSTEKLSVLTCGCSREWFTCQRSAAQTQAKEIESEMQQSPKTSRTASATGGDGESEEEEPFHQLFHEHALPIMLKAVEAADSATNAKMSEEQVAKMVDRITEEIKKEGECEGQTAREREGERGGNAGERG